jgi:copper chaperone CopZ
MVGHSRDRAVPPRPVTTDHHPPRRPPVEATYQVTGMTCGHCARSVQTEVGALPGVSEVRVDVANGAVTVRSEQPLDEAAVRAAVDEAGYTLVS